MLPRTRGVDRLLVKRQGSNSSNSSSTSTQGGNLSSHSPTDPYPPRTASGTRPFYHPSARASTPRAKFGLRGFLKAAATKPKRFAFSLAVALVSFATIAFVYTRFVGPRWSHSIPDEAPRKKLDYRWWEFDEPPQEDLAALLPRPVIDLSPPPPQVQPVSPESRPDSGHSLAQILRLPSSYTSASPPVTWSAIVHLHTPESTTSNRITSLLASLTKKQPVAPAHVLLLLPRSVRPPSDSFLQDGKVSVIAYSHTRGQTVAERDYAALLAVIRAASTGEIDSDFVLFVGAEQEHLAPMLGPGSQYVKALLHASGTKEYRAAILAAGGLSLAGSAASVATPAQNQQQDDLCIFPSREENSSPASSSLLSQRISIPTSPFLVPVSWLVPRDPSDPTHTSIVQGLAPPSGPRAGGDSDGFGIAGLLAAAMWTKHGVPTFALPLSSKSTAAVRDAPDSGPCARLRSLLTREVAALNGVHDSTRGLRELFAPHVAAGEGLRLSQASGDRARGGAKPAASTSPGDHALAVLARSEELKSELLQTGTAVILVSGADELDAVRRLACRFAAQGVGRRASANEEADAAGPGQHDPRRDRPRIKRDLKVIVADLDLATWSEPDDSSASCHLDLTPLRGGTLTAGADGAGISIPLLDILESLDPPPAFMLYLTDSPRAREFEEVLRWAKGYFGPRQGQERLSRVRAERVMLRGGANGRMRPTVVAMSKAEVRRAEWIGALSLEALRHFHTPRIDISVVTNDRPSSLHRLLSSLRTAHYYGDDVALALNLEQTADRLTHRLTDDLHWPHGGLSVRHRILLGGLMPAIVESWYPASNDTYGVLLEDDVEVSPLFYGWLKFTILHYRYTLAGRRASPRLFGVSLYQQKNIELRPEGRQPFDAHRLFRELSLHATSPYLSQIPCSWGAAYFPEQWREFHTYLALRLSELALPISESIVPEIRSNRWPRSWKKYFIELVYLRGYTMLYPNYPNFQSLSTNHLEVGTHVRTAVELKKKLLFEVPLLDRSASLVSSLPGPPGHEQLPGWSALPVIDLWGSLASAEELLERGWQTTRMIGACGDDGSPPLEPTYLTHPRYDAHELLCRRVWNTDGQGRLVTTQPLRGSDVREEDDDDLLPHHRMPSSEEVSAAFSEPTSVDTRRRPVELGNAAARVDPDDDVPTVERLDILPTNARDLDSDPLEDEDDAA